MRLQGLFPYALGTFAALSMLSVSGIAQNIKTNEGQVAQVAETAETKESSSLENEPVIISVASPEEIKAARTPEPRAEVDLLRFEQLISTAIDKRLGTHYSWGGTGPSGFDCSGFVWSTFHSAGIDFERASARNLWARFSSPPPAERFKFGTLVFFSGLSHIGIVAGRQGFYHASRHHGVVFSPFDDYWLSRIDGFRRVPLAATSITD